MVNTVLISNEDNGSTLLIDPGDGVDQIIKIIKENNIQLTGIMATHAHIDHVYSAHTFCNKYNLPFYVPEKDKSLLRGISMQAAMFGLQNPELPKDIRYLSSEDKILPFKDFPFKIIHTPGHSPGSICLQYENFLIAGDTLFLESIGRTDLPGGNMGEILSSIKNKLFILNDDIKVYPGHGDSTTIGYEKIHNPFTGSKKY